MSKGIKIVALAAVLLVVVYLGATYWIGNLIQREYHQQIVTAAARTAGLEITASSYRKSFFSSSVTTELTFPVFQQDATEPPSIIFQSKVQHGPLIFSGEAAPAFLLLSSETKIVQTTGSWATLLTEVPELKELTMADRLTFFWQYQNHTQFPGIDREFSDDGETIIWQTAPITADFFGELRPAVTLQGEVSIPGGKFQVPAEGAVLALNDCRLELDVRQMLETLYAGSSTLKVQSLLASSSKPGEEFLAELDNLEFGAIVDIVNGMFEEQFTYMLEKLQVNEETYGPAVLKLAVSNLDANVLASFQKELQSAQAVLATNSQDTLAVQKTFGKIQDLALPLLKKSPKLEIAQLMVNTPFGKLASKGQVQIDGDRVQGIDPPNQLLAALVADGDLSIDKDLMQEIGQLITSKNLEKKGLQPTEIAAYARQQTQAQIENLLTKNILVDAGTTYQLQVKFNGGSAFLNVRQLQ